MTHHLDQIQLIVKESHDYILNEFVKCAEGIRITGPQIVDVREKTLLSNDDSTSIAVRRVYIQVHDSGDLKSVGWIINDSSEQCSLCQASFSFVSWKHHCRCCGLTVCSACSSHRVLLKGFDHLNPQRICDNCNKTTMERSVSVEDNTKWGTSVLSTLQKHSATMMEINIARSHDSVSEQKTEQLIRKSSNDLHMYGAVYVRQVLLGFVIQASRMNRSIVFINVCTNIYVPLHDEGADIETSGSLFFVVGAIGKTDKGLDVYDVIVHPSLVEKCAGADSVSFKKAVCEQILFGMSELGLEEQFSILFVLPDTFPYRERTFSDADLDAAELDYMHLKATGELLLPLDAAASEPGRVLTAVIPCAAAFYHFPRVATSRADLAGSEQSSPRQCGRYNHIILRDDGTLTSSQPGAIGNLFGSWGQPVRGTRATAASVGYGLSELRVETRKQGVKAFVRGTITLTPTGGYVIDAPKTFNDAGSDLDGVSAVGSTAVVENNGLAWPRVRINVLQHAIVDDLVAMGVVSSAPDALPVLLSEPGTSRDVYNVLVSTSHIKEVEGRVGPSFESRIVQIIRNVNKHFAEVVDEEQYVLTGLSVQGAAAAASGSCSSMLIGDDDACRSVQDKHRTTFILYEYPLDISTSPSSSSVSSLSVHGVLGESMLRPPNSEDSADNNNNNSDNTTTTGQNTPLPLTTVEELLKKDFVERGPNGSLRIGQQDSPLKVGKSLKKGWTVKRFLQPK